MTKNTRANITLIFSISKRTPELDKALDAIARQTDKNCNLVFVFNGCGASEKDVFKKYNFKSFNKVEHVLFSENLGDVYAFQYVAKNNLSTKYYYYLDSNIILLPDFVATLNKFVTEHPDADVVSFFGVPNIYFKEEYLVIKTLSDDFCTRPLVFFDNKLISLDFYKKAGIKEQLFRNYQTLFYVMLAKGNPKWYSIGRQICSGSLKPIYTYNIMDLYDQCVELVGMLDQKWYKDHYSEIEYLCMVTLFRNFISAAFAKYRGNLVIVKRLLRQIDEFFEDNFPNWYKNEWLYSSKNKNDKSYLEYLRDFKPKLKHVKRAVRNKLFVQGHAKSTK